MEQWLENKLEYIEDRYLFLDNMLMLDNRDETYQLEYEYLRGQRDIVLELLEFIKNN